jgi:hypothetical protein
VCVCVCVSVCVCGYVCVCFGLAGGLYGRGELQLFLFPEGLHGPTGGSL